MSDFIIGEVCLLPSLQSPSKNLPKQLASTCFFPWLPQLAQSQTWRQQAASVKKKDKASLSACSDVEPSLRYISPAPGWRITSHSLLFYFFFVLSLLCVWTFIAHPHSHAWSLYSPFPHFVRTFLGLPKFLVLFFYWTKSSRNRKLTFNISCFEACLPELVLGYCLVFTFLSWTDEIEALFIDKKLFFHSWRYFQFIFNISDICKFWYLCKYEYCRDI